MFTAIDNILIQDENGKRARVEEYTATSLFLYRYGIYDRAYVILEDGTKALWNLDKCNPVEKQ